MKMINTVLYSIEYHYFDFSNTSELEKKTESPEPSCYFLPSPTLKWEVLGPERLGRKGCKKINKFFFHKKKLQVREVALFEKIKRKKEEKMAKLNFRLERLSDKKKCISLL